MISCNYKQISSMMETALTWKRNWFSSAYQILAGGISVGTLKEKAFQRSAFGNIGDQHYKFQQKGWLKPYTEIIDLNTGEKIGSISFSSWKFKATVTIGTQQMYWSYRNFWQNKWELSDFAGDHITFKGNCNKGAIAMTYRDDLLVLIGLLISNYYQNMMSVYPAIIFPLLMIG